MRTYQILAIRDVQANVFNPPVFTDTVGGAIREFNDMCMNRETVYGRHPEHFELFLLGTWTDSTDEEKPSAFALLRVPEQVAAGVNITK